MLYLIYTISVSLKTNRYNSVFLPCTILKYDYHLVDKIIYIYFCVCVHVCMFYEANTSQGITRGQETFTFLYKKK